MHIVGEEEDVMYEEVEYQRDDVLLLVESVDGSMVITHANMDATDTYHMVTYLVGRLADITGQTYNQVCEDIKEIEESE